MYEQFFHLTKKPFSIAPDPGFLYLSDRHRDALAHLKYGLDSEGGFVLVTGEVGTGKTTLLRNLIGQVPGDIDVAFILNPRLTVRELLQTICDELSIEYPSDDQHSVKPYIDRLNQHLLRTHSAKRSTVVVIDEAQNLSPAVLEQLRLLTNLETDEQKLLRIILVGQPELNAILGRTELRQLSQRITARYHLEPLQLRDTRAYLAHRLTVSGGNPQLFSKAASWNIHRIAGGIPRLINIIADRSLLGAFVEGKPRIDLMTTQRAARETLNRSWRFTRWLTLATVLVAGVGGAWAYWEYRQGSLTLFGDTQQTARQATTATPEPARVAPVQASTTSAANPALSAAAQRAAARAAGQTAAEQASGTVPPATTVEVEGAVSPTATPAERLAEAARAGLGSSREPVLSQVPLPIGGVRSFTSQRNAFATMFEAWRIEYDPTAALVPCDFAVQYQLQCTRRRGDWNSVRRFNVPVILEMRSPEGAPYFLTALATTTDRVAVAHAGRHYNVALRDLEAAWSGNFFALWPMPEQYRGSLRRGANEPAVIELRKLLGVALRQDLGYSPRFDSALQQILLRFQRQHGLTSDGIAGPATWLMLHRAAGYDIPELVG